MNRTQVAQTKKMKKRNEILKTCCQVLKNKYKTYFSYMRSFLWEGKRNDFPLKDYFVELTVEKADLFGKKIGEKISLNEIFSIEQEGHQTILVTGDPGYGKSTLCKKNVYDWATTNYLKHFDLTFIVILRELSDRSVKDALLDDIHEYSPKNKNWNLQDKQLNILVILDGFDEIVEKSKIITFIRQESFYISRRMTIVVTSRPKAAEDIREDMNMRFSIEGFSLKYQEKYIYLMLREDERKARLFYHALIANDFLRKIGECPLMLRMLCCLCQNGEMEKLDTMTDLYIRIFSLITERYVRKTNQQDKFKRGKFFVGENLLLKLGEICRQRYIITSECLRYYFPKKDEYNFIMGLDILTLNSFSQYHIIIEYNFVHRTFGEFLTALLRYFNFFPFIRIGDVELQFLLGFYNDKPLPKKFLKCVEKNTFDSNSLRLVYRYMKVKKK
ncbi:NACHT, LRR and PYD domains-containing protein 2-like [Centruroides sculpturatus]|uniref:NACHT, LRR and PYD domains-containing protein 2-like n=1 Tax=Centruroides sculpturatus TaxID=218467 RepID=UPI000C6D4BDA|nr:NACHT, LRR and PYD domains-containing protein 2-like [Centruroides sculpturatus]XP_023211137.1 NACHT, LRR and PYD domains-containing protein 2-like [Centruroides sculpturatus]XP_023211138.1 NACHT, LRR and PYD domains-containing protein 2-like [Centruroides sculpturatus]XP_023211139.1 NACHT, LRR and PYD domains-containing protein 2-like [Centruroides sculpturatus]XP_023211140.1 NACHT, LRR and PYD domains-containing protein 2-like [Centruroides sculpturatus]XP_023211141.1 NACHT, LRR and PYD d